MNPNLMETLGDQEHILVSTRRMRELKDQIAQLDLAQATDMPGVDERLRELNSELDILQAALSTLESHGCVVVNADATPTSQRFFVLRFEDSFAAAAMGAYVKDAYHCADSLREEARANLVEACERGDSPEVVAAAVNASLLQVNRLEAYTNDIVAGVLAPMRRLMEARGTKIPE